MFLVLKDSKKTNTMNWEKIAEKYPKASWKDVEGTNGCYRVSNTGLVYSVRSDKLMSPGKATNGYLMLMFSINGSVTSPRVHRLVANAFVPNSEGKPEVNHIDSDRENNHYINLEWVTRSENLRHCVDTRDVIDGENNYKAAFKRWEIIIIRYLCEVKNYKPPKIALIFNAKYNTIHQITTYLRYKKIKLPKVSSEEISGCLFRFFDVHEINIVITPEYYFTGINWCWQLLWHTPEGLECPQCEGTYLYGDNGEYDTRTEAENAAFIKAFEKLEEKLTN